MPETLQCPNCRTRYQFDPALVGRAIRCRVCGMVFRIPDLRAPESGEDKDSAAEAEKAPSMPPQRWYLRFPSGRQFGPVVRAMIEEWIGEGRADGASLVCQEGSTEWLPLAEVFPDLIPAPADTAYDGYAPAHLPAGAVPAEGLLDWIADERHLLTAEETEHHDSAVEQLSRECRRTLGAVHLRDTRMIRMGERICFGESVRPPEQLRPESAVIASLASQTGEYYLIMPWGRLGALPHEFFSILPGRLASSVALRRATEEDFAGGQWIGVTGTETDVIATAARLAQDELARGIAWKWFSRDRDYTMTLVWGIQAVPLGSEKFLHAVQSSLRVGPSGMEFGVLWYRERQSAFFRFARKLNIPDLHETHVLFGCCHGQIISAVTDRAVN